MTESPPATPVRQILLTPTRYLDSSDEGNEENALNFANTPRSSRRNQKSLDSLPSDVVIDNEMSSIERTLSTDSDGASEVSVARLKGWLDDFGKQNRDHYEKNNPKSDGDSIQKAPSMDSDAESDLSVARLKGWLNDFGKQNRAHYDKVNKIGEAPSGVALKKPVRPKSATESASQPVVTKPPIRRHTDPSVATVEAKKGPAKTPVRYKRRYKKDEVQATNDGYASVSKIAAWLADDPTADKKMTTVRKGINVINKSRMFEKDLENVIIEENRIVKGSVSNKKNFFQSALNGEEDKLETASCVSVSDKKKWLEGAFAKPPIEEEPDDEDDVASFVSMSVVDKRQWLQGAFKTAGEGRDSKPTTPARFQAKPRRTESAPGVPTLSPMRNEAAVNMVKERFQKRAASRRSLSDASDPSEAKSSEVTAEATAAKHKWQVKAARRSSLQPPAAELEPISTEEVNPSEPPEKRVAQPSTNSSVADPSEKKTSEVKAEMTTAKHKWHQIAARRSSLQGPPNKAGPMAAEEVKSFGFPEKRVSGPSTNCSVARWRERKAAKEAAGQSPATPVRKTMSLERKPSISEATSPSPAVTPVREKAPLERKPSVTETTSPSPVTPVREKAPLERKPSVTKASSGPAGPVQKKVPLERKPSLRENEQSPATLVRKKAPLERKPSVPEAAATESKVNEEETHVDFKAAREKLVKRSAQNGNPVTVLNKVQRRKQKFERIEQAMRRRSNPMGLLKPTWEQASEDTGPSTSYTKAFVDNIAPKKSFEDLP